MKEVANTWEVTLEAVLADLRRDGIRRVVLELGDVDNRGKVKVRVLAKDRRRTTE